MLTASDWNASGYAKHGAFVPQLGESLIDLLAPKHGERILDLGCGDGTLTARIVERGAEVIGFDQSCDLVAAARTRGLDVRLGDARNLPFNAEFDAVFSNAALHWMDDPDAVLAGVARALVPGGRFVAEFGAHGNVASVRTALHALVKRRGLDPARVDPWYFPSSRAYRTKLEQHGFVVETIDSFARPTELPTDLGGWLDTFARSFFDALSIADRESLRRDVIALLTPIICDEDGKAILDYVRLRLRASVPKR